MKTRLIRVDPTHPEDTAVAEAAALVRQGELVAFPTETVYGLGLMPGCCGRAPHF